MKKNTQETQMKKTQDCNIKFQPKEFRKLESGTTPPRIREHGPLILIKSNGEATYAVDRSEKDSLISSFDETTDLLLWGWVGEWRTDIFILNKADLDRCYDRENHDMGYVKGVLTYKGTY